MKITTANSVTALPIPPHFDPTTIESLRPIPYHDLQIAALDWKNKHNLHPSALDQKRIALMIIDAQNTFCTPGFELVVNGAVDDNRRLAEFIYRYLGTLTDLYATLDTHTAMQIFHSIFLVDKKGNPVSPNIPVTKDDILNGTYRVNPAVAYSLQDGNLNAIQHHLIEYVTTLDANGRYDLTVWDYHAMLGSIGHALVPAIEEAIFFHTIARSSQAGFEIKGSNPFTENYSIVGPEVTTSGGAVIEHRNDKFVEKLLEYDIVIIAGQAKSHCVAWTIDDILTDIMAQDPALASKIYLLEDCTSPVVIPGIVDFTDEANEAFDRFAQAGMHVVRSTDPIETWPGVNL